MEEKKLTPEEEELLKFYVKPHAKISREVEEKDLQKVLEDGEKMYKLCSIKRGLFPSALAIAHQQINDSDPMRFFVTCNGDIMINPVIIRHTNQPIEDLEGCMSFPYDMPVKVPRWYKITAEYITVDEEALENGIYKFGNKVTAKLKGIEARYFQHEIDHLNSKYIYSI